jgi:hypothetical protein
MAYLRSRSQNSQRFWIHQHIKVPLAKSLFLKVQDCKYGYSLNHTKGTVFLEELTGSFNPERGRSRRQGVNIWRLFVNTQSCPCFVFPNTPVKAVIIEKVKLISNSQLSLAIFTKDVTTRSVAVQFQEFVGLIKASSRSYHLDCFPIMNYIVKNKFCTGFAFRYDTACQSDHFFRLFAIPKPILPLRNFFRCYIAPMSR